MLLSRYQVAVENMAEKDEPFTLLIVQSPFVFPVLQDGSAGEIVNAEGIIGSQIFLVREFTSRCRIFWRWLHGLRLGPSKVSNEECHLGWCSATIDNAKPHPRIEGNLLRLVDGHEQPRALGIDDSPSIQESGIGAGLGGIGTLFCHFRGDPTILGLLCRQKDHPVALFSGLLYLRQLILIRFSLPLYRSEAFYRVSNANAAYYNEKSRENHVNLFPVGHRSGFTNDDGFISIGFTWGAAGVLICLGTIRILDRKRRVGWLLICSGVLLDALATASGCIGCLPWNWWACLHDGQEHSQREIFHGGQSVSQKSLTAFHLCNTFSDMANVLSGEKQTAIIAALAEGSSIRSIERTTGVHRDTIMRLGVRVGQGCTALLDEKMRNLPCRLLQFDEVWGFIGKKERHLRPDDDPQYGNVWTFCAIDAETKLVPSFKCGKRDLATAKTFVADVQSRMAGRVQISSDALKAYQDAIEQTFGADVDFGQIIKTYEHDDSQNAERKYSAAKFISVEKRSVTGSPDMDLVSTSYVERLNATTRLHMRRLTRLTLAFSKKLENFEAAVGLHFAYYNFVKRHNSLRCTPAMAAGVERDFWSVADLVEATA